MNIDEKLELKERNDVEFVLSTESGRAFLWRVLSLCGVYQDINTDGEQETGRKLGQRSIGLLLMQIIGDADQDKLFQMMKEAKFRQEETEVELKKQEEVDGEINADIPSMSSYI
ncbi:MAG: hypothetical protein Unbinned1322contig1000_60 [Prokaryotic dsDNA virus sp.]|nr:hypothetical protein [Aequorivita sp.]QDP57316.1 MAG: hypothetical protein Unbinned1322contig1000_60 [Prokaryotic dsDNA virus sp.]|tara:strand:+ start:5610 stop:5951 length:342 start_codon:yes stop_codon:yes gene_type:complete